MAIEVRHSRTATLVDSGANPGYDADEIQAADWNAAHPITGDGMGLLFSDDAGAVAETMTVDMGTLTASTPLTFTQTWDNAAQDVVFQGVRVFVQDDDGATTSGDLASQYFAVQTTDGTDTYTRLDVRRDEINVVGNLNVFTGGSVEFGTRQIQLNSAGGNFILGDNTADNAIATYSKADVTFDYSNTPGDPPDDSATYGSTGITRSAASADFTLPISETALASWANVPTNTDIVDGYSQCGIDTNTGDVYLAANVGGTIFKVQLT